MKNFIVNILLRAGKNNIFLIIILFSSSILRFWKVPELFQFALDEEYQAHLAATIVKDFHPIWIGVSAADTGFYLGPFFTYLNALLFWISKGDPLILGYFASFLGVVTTLIIYLVTKNLFNKNSALIASFLYAFSTLMVFYDRRFWNPTLIPILSLGIFFTLSKIYKDTRWLILTAFLIGLSFHSHLSLLIYIPIIIFILVQNIKKIRAFTWLISILSFLVTIFPLIVFDIVHEYSNMQSLLGIFINNSHSTRPSIFVSNHLNELLSALARFWAIKPFSSITDESIPGPMLFKTSGHILLSLISILVIIGSFFKAKGRETKLLLAVITFFIIFFVIYSKVVQEYYLLGVFPLFALLAGLFLSRFKKTFLIPLLLIFALYNSYSLFTTTQSYGLATKKELITDVSQFLGESRFYLGTSGSYRSFGGWRYLFKEYGRIPERSQSDELFGWLYQDEISNGAVDYKVIISDSTSYQIDDKDKLAKVIQRSGYYAYILQTK